MSEIRQTFIIHRAKIVSAERDPFYPRHSLYQNFSALQRHSNKLKKHNFLILFKHRKCRFGTNDFEPREY